MNLTFLALFTLIALGLWIASYITNWLAARYNARFWLLAQDADFSKEQV